jgi:hypothetical protein
MPWVLGERSVSYSFAVNQFEGVKRFASNEAREAFDLKPDTPMTSLDARDRGACLRSLITLAESLFHRLESRL